MSNPREVLMMMAVGFIFANAAASMMWWVAGVSGMCSET